MAFEPTGQPRRGADLVTGPDSARTRMLLLEMIGGLGGIARGVTDPLIARERRRAGMDGPLLPAAPQPYAPATPAPGLALDDSSTPALETAPGPPETFPAGGAGAQLIIAPGRQTSRSGAKLLQLFRMMAGKGF